MEHPQDPQHPAPVEGARAESIGCQEARRLLAVFCRGRLDADSERLFRAHLPICEECRQLYRETLGGLARLGREKRARRRERRRREHREMAVRAAVQPKRRRFGLRLVLVPALLICALSWLRPFSPETGLTMLVTAGEVRVEDTSHGVQGERLELSRAQWCELDETALATFVGPEVEIHVEPKTYLLIEEPEPARLRLKNGSLEMEGFGLVTSAWGVLECRDGHARIELRDGKLEVTCISGAVAWTSPEGQQILQAGETLGSDEILGAAKL